MPPEPQIRSLVRATDVDVMAAGKTLDRRDGYWRVACPDNPGFWWGNLLIFDAPPETGEWREWEATFAREFADAPGVRHSTFAWDTIDGSQGAIAELIDRGYEAETLVGLVAGHSGIVEHARSNREVPVKALDPQADEQLWKQVLESSIAWSIEDGESEPESRSFNAVRQRELRELFRAGRGAWYVALDGDRVIASLGIVVTGGRARFQSVVTDADYRRRGIATRLVAEASRQAASAHEIDNYVIAADPDYHALGIYESLGFQRAETVVGACRRPPTSSS